MGSSQDFEVTARHRQLFDLNTVADIKRHFLARFMYGSLCITFGSRVTFGSRALSAAALVLPEGNRCDGHV